MTGKDLIIYILEHDLSEKQIDDMVKFLNAVDVNKAAVVLNSGPITTEVYVERNVIDGFRIKDDIYVLPTNKIDIVLDKQKTRKKQFNWG